MDGKDIRQRFVGLQHQIHSHQDDKSPQDDEKRRSSPLRHWCRIIVMAALIPVLFVILYLNVLADENSLPVAFSLPDPPRLEGSIKPNNHLHVAEKLYEGKVLGPESIVLDHGHLYTGTSDGKILHVYKGEIRTLATLGKPPCVMVIHGSLYINVMIHTFLASLGNKDGVMKDRKYRTIDHVDRHPECLEYNREGGYANEQTCGRPLGMRLDSNGYLIVCDTTLGIHKINVATGDVHLLLPSSVNITGHLPHFLNDLDIDSDGNIYFTDASYLFPRRDFVLEMLDGRGTGRFMRYDPLRNSTEVLLENLYFANGVQLSRYDDFVLVVETSRARIIKYHLKGVKAGHVEVFVENLPCFPDNIRRSSSGGYWVACISLRHDGQFNLYDFIGPRPWIRWIALKVLSQSFVMKLFPPGAMLLELNAQGHIVRALMDLTGEKVCYSSEVAADADSLYVGSFSKPFIVRVRLDRLRSVAD